jgi:hypothetical protein
MKEFQIIMSVFFICGAAIAITGIIVDGKSECPEPVCPEAVVQCPVANLSCPAAPDLSCAPCPNCTCNPVNTWTVHKDFSSHLYEVASSAATELEYTTEERWDCDDMAAETAERLQHAGYDCDDVCGWYYEYEWWSYPDGRLEQHLAEKTRHCWVECNHVIIEATTAEDTIVSAEDYERYKR